MPYWYDGSYNDGGGGVGWENYEQPGSAVDMGGGWMYDPTTDEYYRPDGDYSGGNTYTGNPTFTATGTGYNDDPEYYGGGTDDPGGSTGTEDTGPTFVGGDIEMNPIDPIPSESPYTLDPTDETPYTLPTPTSPTRTPTTPTGPTQYFYEPPQTPPRTTTPRLPIGINTGFTPQPTTPTGPTQFLGIPPVVRDVNGPIRVPSIPGLPISIPNPFGGGGGSSTSNTTNNKTANVNQTVLASETMNNALPPIANSTPAANPETFDPQYIPQAERAASPAWSPAAMGTDPGSGYDYGEGDSWEYGAPSSPGTSTGNGYDYGEGDSWKYGGMAANQGPHVKDGITGSDYDYGEGDSWQYGKTGGGQSALRRGITGGIQGLTGLNIASPKAFGDSLLGLTGANRYRGLIQDPKKKKKPFTQF